MYTEHMNKHAKKRHCHFLRQVYLDIKKPPKLKHPLTSDLSDTLEGVFECIESTGVALGLALRWQAELQLLDGLH